MKVKSTHEKHKHKSPDFDSVFIIVTILMAILLIKACDYPGRGERTGQTKSGLVREERIFGDREIEKFLMDKLMQQEGIDAENIKVHAENGHVRLSGHVGYLSDKRWITEAAEMIKGVVFIENNLQVSPGVVTDIDIQHDVSLALVKSPYIEIAEATAVVDDGTVILRGEVDSWSEKITAEQIVAGVKGVRSVDNNIYVEHDTTRHTNEIAEDLKAALQLDPVIDYNSLRVMVKDSGDVTIHGAVGSIFEKKRIVSLSMIDGVQTIDVGDVKVVPRLQAEATGN